MSNCSTCGNETGIVLAEPGSRTWCGPCWHKAREESANAQPVKMTVRAMSTCDACGGVAGDFDRFCATCRLGLVRAPDPHHWLANRKAEVSCQGQFAAKDRAEQEVRRVQVQDRRGGWG